MSTTTARTEANRANAGQSTGPRTLEGKVASSRNALRHGFLANVLPAEQEDYRRLVDLLHFDLQAKGLMQTLLVEEIALGYIRLRRLHAAELNAMEPREYTIEAITREGRRTENHTSDGCTPAEYLRHNDASLVLRYEAAVERQIQRCLARLTELKSHDTWKAVRRAREAAILAAANSPESTPEPAPEEKLDLRDLIAISRQQRLAQMAELDRFLGKGRRPAASHNNGFVSQNNDSAANAASPEPQWEAPKPCDPTTNGRPTQKPPPYAKERA